MSKQSCLGRAGVNRRSAAEWASGGCPRGSSVPAAPCFSPQAGSRSVVAASRSLLWSRWFCYCNSEVGTLKVSVGPREAGPVRDGAQQGSSSTLPLSPLPPSSSPVQLTGACWCPAWPCVLSFCSAVAVFCWCIGSI